jgi:hypothetical protein
MATSLHSCDQPVWLMTKTKPLTNLPYTRLQREASTEIRRARSRACGEDQRTNRGQ